MYALAILRYRKPLEEVLQHVDAHRAYCQGPEAGETVDRFRATGAALWWRHAAAGPR